MIPRHKSCIPPSIVIMQIMLGHPETGSPKIAALTNINTAPINAKRQHNIPSTEAIDNGAVEKAAIPSIEYTKSFQKLHLVSPAQRSAFSKAIHFVLNPTQPKIPLLKRLYSPRERILSTIRLVINL